MPQNENVYYDYYQKAKITPDELKQFPALRSKTDEELDIIADNLYDLAVLFQKISIEEHE